jgi:hypothetical protein
MPPVSAIFSASFCWAGTAINSGGKQISIPTSAGNANSSGQRKHLSDRIRIVSGIPGEGSFKSLYLLSPNGENMVSRRRILLPRVTAFIAITQRESILDGRRRGLVLEGKNSE